MHAAAYQLPALLVDLLHACDRFHENVVRDAGFGHPDGTKQVCPFTVDGLFESSALVWTKNAGLGEHKLALQSMRNIPILTTVDSGETVHFRQSHCPSGMYGTP